MYIYMYMYIYSQPPTGSRCSNLSISCARSIVDRYCAEFSKVSALE